MILDKLDAIIEEHKYSKHAFVQDVVNGDIEKQKIKDWAIQKYFQVYYQVQGFSAVHSNCEYEDVRLFMVEQLSEEETGDGCGSDSHYNLMKRFALSLGAVEEDFKTTAVGPAVKQHVDRLLRICKGEHFIYGLLAFYVFESQTSESAQKMFNGFQQHFGSTDAELEWFSVHGEADIEHSKMHRRLIEKYCADLADFEQRGTQQVIEGCESWNNLQNYYYSLIK